MINYTCDNADKCLSVMLASLNQTLCLAVRFLLRFASETLGVKSKWPRTGEM